MRVAITQVVGMHPVVLENMTAVILAACDGAEDGSTPCIAKGSPEDLAHLASVILYSVRQKLGQKAFDAVVRHARDVEAKSLTDITDAVRSAGSGSK